MATKDETIQVHKSIRVVHKDVFTIFGVEVPEGAGTGIRFDRNVVLELSVEEPGKPKRLVKFSSAEVLKRLHVTPPEGAVVTLGLIGHHRGGGRDLEIEVTHTEYHNWALDEAE